MFVSVTHDHGEVAHVDAGCFTKQASEVLDILRIRAFCNTFSETEKRQKDEVWRFKEAVHAKENEEKFCLFVKISFKVKAAVLLLQQGLRI